MDISSIISNPNISDEVHNLLDDNGVVTGIGLFDDESISISVFNERMNKYFHCKEMIATKRPNYFKFTYIRKKDYSYLDDYLNIFFKTPHETYTTELEMRIKVDVTMFNRVKDIIKPSIEQNIGYTSYRIHLYDQRLREYDDGTKDMKILLFRKHEVTLGFKYYICLSYETEIHDEIDNKILDRNTMMVRWTKKESWGTIYLSKREETYDIEVEVEKIEHLNMARRYLVSVMRQAKYKIDMDDRIVIYGVKGLGIWKWDKQQNIKPISNVCGNNIIIDAKERDNKYEFIDIMDQKMNKRCRSKLLKNIKQTWMNTNTSLHVI